MIKSIFYVDKKSKVVSGIFLTMLVIKQQNIKDTFIEAQMKEVAEYYFRLALSLTHINAFGVSINKVYIKMLVRLHDILVNDIEKEQKNCLVESFMDEIQKNEEFFLYDFYKSVEIKKPETSFYDFVSIKKIIIRETVIMKMQSNEKKFLDLQTETEISSSQENKINSKLKNLINKKEIKNSDSEKEHPVPINSISKSNEKTTNKLTNIFNTKIKEELSENLKIEENNSEMINSLIEKIKLSSLDLLGGVLGYQKNLGFTKESRMYMLILRLMLFFDNEEVEFEFLVMTLKYFIYVNGVDEGVNFKINVEEFFKEFIRGTIEYYKLGDKKMIRDHAIITKQNNFQSSILDDQSYIDKYFEKFIYLINQSYSNKEQTERNTLLLIGPNSQISLEAIKNMLFYHSKEISSIKILQIANLLLKNSSDSLSELLNILNEHYLECLFVPNLIKSTKQCSLINEYVFYYLRYVQPEYGLKTKFKIDQISSLTENKINQFNFQISNFMSNIPFPRNEFGYYAQRQSDSSNNEAGKTNINISIFGEVFTLSPKSFGIHSNIKNWPLVFQIMLDYLEINATKVLVITTVMEYWMHAQYMYSQDLKIMISKKLFCLASEIFTKISSLQPNSVSVILKQNLVKLLNKIIHENFDGGFIEIFEPILKLSKDTLLKKPVLSNEINNPESEMDIMIFIPILKNNNEQSKSIISNKVSLYTEIQQKALICSIINYIFDFSSNKHRILEGFSNSQTIIFNIKETESLRDLIKSKKDVNSKSWRKNLKNLNLIISTLYKLMFRNKFQLESNEQLIKDKSATIILIKNLLEKDRMEITNDTDVQNNELDILATNSEHLKKEVVPNNQFLDLNELSNFNYSDPFFLNLNNHNRLIYFWIKSILNKEKLVENLMMDILDTNKNIKKYSRDELLELVSMIVRSVYLLVSIEVESQMSLLLTRFQLIGITYNKLNYNVFYKIPKVLNFEVFNKCLIDYFSGRFSNSKGYSIILSEVLNYQKTKNHIFKRSYHKIKYFVFLEKYLIPLLLVISILFYILNIKTNIINFFTILTCLFKFSIFIYFLKRLLSDQKTKSVFQIFLVLWREEFKELFTIFLILFDILTELSLGVPSALILRSYAFNLNVYSKILYSSILFIFIIMTINSFEFFMYSEQNSILTLFFIFRKTVNSIISVPSIASNDNHYLFDYIYYFAKNLYLLFVVSKVNSIFLFKTKELY